MKNKEKIEELIGTSDGTINKNMDGEFIYMDIQIVPQQNIQCHFPKDIMHDH